MLEGSQAPNSNQRSKVRFFCLFVLTGPINLIICGEVVIICWTASWHIKMLSPLTLKDTSATSESIWSDTSLLHHIATFISRCPICLIYLDQCIVLSEDDTVAA